MKSIVVTECCNRQQISRAASKVYLWSAVPRVTTNKWKSPSRLKCNLFLDFMFCSISSWEWEVFVQSAESQHRRGRGATRGKTATSLNLFKSSNSAKQPSWRSGLDLRIMLVALLKVWTQDDKLTFFNRILYTVIKSIKSFNKTDYEYNITIRF